jgi:hypothetical protein
MKRRVSERDAFLIDAYLIERYGKSYRTSPRWKIPAAIVALIGIPWLLWSAGYHSQPSIRHELIAFKVIDPTKVEITYLLERNDSNLEVVCTLVARDFEKNVVGEVTDEFEANDAPSRQTLTRAIPTRIRAVNADVIGCDLR